MDWSTWLSKTNLDPSVIYEYALTFTHNELVLDDVEYFSHEFLLSMGVSIAKHRLEILKLVKKKKGRSVIPLLWLMFAVKKAKGYVVKKMRAFVSHRSLPVSVAPERSHSLRWKVAMMKRNNRLRADPVKAEWLENGGHEILMLTNGSPVEGSRSSASTGSSVWIESEANVNCCVSRNSICSPDKEYSSSSADEIKWDLMFKNMKPT